MVWSRSRRAALSSAIWVSLAVSRARSAATMLVSVSGGGGSSERAATGRWARIRATRVRQNLCGFRCCVHSTRRACGRWVRHRAPGSCWPAACQALMGAGGSVPSFGPLKLLPQLHQLGPVTRLPQLGSRSLSSSSMWWRISSAGAPACRTAGHLRRCSPAPSWPLRPRRVLWAHDRPPARRRVEAATTSLSLSRLKRPSASRQPK